MDINTEQEVNTSKPANASAQHIILRIKERFLKELNTKTSWGKNEVRNLYDDITTEELTRELFLKNKLDIGD